MNRDKEIIKTSIVGIIGNVFLVIGKIFIGVVAASVSIIMDAINNLTDAMSSIVTVVGTKLSGKRPTKKHPYGYGRVEFVTSSLIGMVIFIAGFMAIYESVQSLIAGDKPDYSIYSFIIIGLAVIIKIALGTYFKNRGKKVNSDALSASGTDALMDSVLSLGTLIGAFVSYFFGVYLEGYIGIVIGLFIIKASIDVFTESISKIIGERVDSDLATAITQDVLKTENVLGVYDLIIHNYGTGRYIASLHIEVEDNMTAKEIQLLERKIAYMCFEKYQTIMTVGIYAKNTGTEKEKEIKSKILSIIGGYPEVIQTHGFYADLQNMVISLDIVIGFDCKDPDKTYKEINQKIQSEFPEYSVQLIYDKDFSLTK